MYGWTGKILRIDLSAGETSIVPTSRYVPDFVGGVGIAARIAWQELAPGIGPFDPQNLLFVMAGPLTGTLASGAGRVEVLGIAPATASVRLFALRHGRTLGRRTEIRRV